MTNPRLRRRLWYRNESGETELTEEGEIIKNEPAGPWNKILMLSQTLLLVS